jgi:hypothetical protein
MECRHGNFWIGLGIGSILGAVAYRLSRTAYLPYSTNKEKPMAMAFQNTYEVKPLSEAPQELAFCR